MAFPSTEALIPCLTKRLSPETRKRWKEYYRYGKKYGIRAAFGVITSTGCYTVIKEVAMDGVKCHAKRYLGLIFISTGLTSLTVGIPFVTNATKIVKYSKACHSVCSAAWRAAHNIAELPLIICDYAIFGEHVPSCGEADYDIFSNTATDFISEFTK